MSNAVMCCPCFPLPPIDYVMKILPVCVAVLVSVVGLFGQEIPLSQLGLTPNYPLPSACKDALLFTPEQDAALNAAWEENLAAAASLPPPPQMTDEDRKVIADALQAFVKKRDAIFTPEQVAVRTQINEVATQIWKSIEAEYKPKLDAVAGSNSEFMSLALERNAAFQQKLLQALASSLPQKNREALQAFL